jgi:hypothetical protein
MSEILNKEIGGHVLNIYNKSAISLIRNHVLNERSRHIDTRFHLIREYEANGQISVSFIRTEDQLWGYISSQWHSARSSFRSCAPRLDSTLQQVKPLCFLLQELGGWGDVE